MNTQTEQRRLTVSLGDPAGVGPEVVARALAEIPAGSGGRFLLVGSPRIFFRAAKIVGWRQAETAVAIAEYPNFERDIQIYDPHEWNGDLPEFGKPAEKTGIYSYQWAEVAARLCTNGTADAVVTAPVCKAAWLSAGKKYPGHTELLGAICEKDPLMLLITPFTDGRGLRVATLITHVPLTAVPGLVTREKVVHACVVLHNELQSRLGMFSPRIGVLGLNPHAGESGEIGGEEEQQIAPALSSLRQHGVDAIGPLSADTAFHAMLNEQKYDVILAMYHDQGLAPLKTCNFYGAENITLGVPILRVSPGHGAAFDLAGTGQANPTSMLNAIFTAWMMVGAEREFRRPGSESKRNARG
jgi:4-hydroxythreonine-4-phosphate dehydrogenase